MNKYIKTKRLETLISFNLQLLNSDISLNNFQDVIEDFNKHNIIEETENYIIYKRDSSLVYPEWLKKFSSDVRRIELAEDGTVINTKRYSIEDRKPIKFLKKSSDGILLLIKISNQKKISRIFALSFGTGRFSLKSSVIEKGFGVYTAYHLSKRSGHQLKSYQSRLVDTNPINKKMVFAGETDNENGIPYTIDNEHIKELVISNKDTSIYSRAIGKIKSLEISLSFNNNEIPCLDFLPNKLAPILNEYLSITNEEKQELYKGLILVPSERKDELNKLLIDRINKRKGEFFLFEPEIDFDWTEVNRVIYSKGERTVEDTSKEISFEKMLELCKINSVEDLRNIKIKLISNSSSILKTWTAYQCLYGEIVTNNEVFILSDEEYLQIQKSKYQRICNNITISYSDIKLPSNIHNDIQVAIALLPPQSRIAREYIFNQNYAKSIHAELMDEQSKHINLYEDQFEICDIYDYNNMCFYHSKIKRGPDSISHLFQQGYVSGAAFAKFPTEFIKAMNEKISDVSHHISGNPRGKKIHYLILSQSSAPRLSFFQKMSLEEKLTSLKAWGFEIHYSLIGNCCWAK